MGLSLAYDAWLRSGFNSAGDGGYYLYSDGILYGGVTNRIFAVRPASSNAVNFKKAADIPCFWDYRSFV